MAIRKKNTRRRNPTEMLEKLADDFNQQFVLLSDGRQWAAKVNDLLARNANPVEIRARDHQTLLHQASAIGSSKLAKRLLASGIPVDVRDAFGRTPLHAAVAGEKSTVIRLLLESGADVNAMENNEGKTPLMMAVDGPSSIVEMLLKSGASPDTKTTNNHMTALHFAARYGSASSCKTLIEHGATPEIKNKSGLTALDIARNGEYEETVKILEKAPETIAQRKIEQSMTRHKSNIQALDRILSKKVKKHG